MWVWVWVWADRSPSVEELYRDAHPADARQQKEGVLLLDAANTRVKAADNIVERAERVQDQFPRFTVIVVFGSGGMSCRFAGASEWLYKDGLLAFVNQSSTGSHGEDTAGAQQAKRDKKLYPSVSELLTAIVEQRGLGPIAVIGYTRLLRGESFVSSARLVNGVERRIVPTHLLCGLTPGRCIEDLVQMAGRVTFNGRTALRNNLGQDAKVKILIHFRDWDMALAYYRFQDEVSRRLRAGKTMSEVLSGVGESYDWASDFVAAKGNTGQRANKRARTIGAVKRNNALESTFDVQDEGSAQFAKFFPGRAWAHAQKFLSFDKYGVPWRLDSPIPESETLTFNETGSSIERHLYHEECHLYNPIAVILRRALFLAKASWEQASIQGNQCENAGEEYEFTAADRVTLMKDLPVLRKKQNEFGFVGKVSKVFSEEHAFHTGREHSRWVLQPCTFPLFQVLPNGNFVLHEEILRFAERFKEYLLAQPPLQTFEEIKEFYAAWELRNRGARAEGQPATPQRRRARNTSTTETRPPLTFPGNVIQVSRADQVPEACQRLCSQDQGGLLGFDIEWRAPQFQGDSPGKVALLQLCSGDDCCAVFHLHSMQCVPPALEQLLRVCRLAGCGIKGDLTRMVKDLRIGRPPNVLELSDMANAALMVKKRWSLAKLVDRVVGDRFLDKDLVNVRDVDWEAWPLSEDELKYAANDAYASYYVAECLQNVPLPGESGS